MRLIVLEEVESTQDIARGYALEGAPEGTAVLALRQVKGRGRSGNTWVSPAGVNLALSWILRPDTPPQKAPLLGLLVSIAVAGVAEEFLRRPALLKWPNDVLLDDKKVAGILCEASLENGAISSIIVGVGLNVNSDESDFPPELHGRVTSLFMASGRQFDLEDIARRLLDQFFLLYDRAKSEGTDFIPLCWENRWAHRGAVLVREDVRGTAQGIGPDGSLILKTGDGTVIHITSGIVVPEAPRPEMKDETIKNTE